jgi:hypothetical protein
MSAPTRVINLGFNNEGAFAFLPTLQDFRYLDYDIVCLYEGYNDLPGDEGPNTAVFRHESPIFRLTGLFPDSAGRAQGEGHVAPDGRQRRGRLRGGAE